ncbi:MAG: hypothetical protein R3B13_05120 [Polyangiaceae bacterium]
MNPGLSSLELPKEYVAWGALVLGAGLLLLTMVPAWARRLIRTLGAHPRASWVGLAFGAAVLSATWVAVYLRGGPRIIDATTYLLEARALAAGQLTWTPPGSLTSHVGRFLVSPANADTLGAIFPPGYPLLLSVGAWFGHPMAVGPVLAAALVGATYALARALFDDTRVALLAAAVSTACAALRYHTADTMSHGASALWLCLGLFGAVRGGRHYWLTGLCLGAALATRPVSGLVLGAVTLLLAVRARAGAGGLRVALGSLPGIALLLAHQHATTGGFLRSSQGFYYSLADGPAGCFRFGFGRGVGCTFEHGDFVQAHLQDGFGVLQALGTTGRRLLWHALDVGNVELIAYLAVLTAVYFRRDARVRLLALTVAGLFVAYGPFYFDGSYPGGGARMFADVLPLEHVLVAFGALRLGVARFVLPTMLVGFALRASHGHDALAAREGGRPMFEPETLRAAGLHDGLVFVDTDHGYALGADPRASDPTRTAVVARHRGDRSDWLTWEALGRPRSYRYVYDLLGRQPPRLDPYEPEPLAHFGVGSFWPLRGVSAGYAYPAPATGCGTLNRGLRISPDRDGNARVTLRLPWSNSGQLRTQWAAAKGGKAAAVRVRSGGELASEFKVLSTGCALSPPILPRVDQGWVTLEVEVGGDPAVLVAVEQVLPPKGVDN